MNDELKKLAEAVRDQVGYIGKPLNNLLAAILDEPKPEQHSPTPWRVDKGDTYFSLVDATGRNVGVWGAVSEPAVGRNPELICRAVNAHEQLVAALKSTRSFLDNDHHPGAEDRGSMRAECQAAIAKAEGGSNE